jgi:pyrroloquinoline quinone biosynthesis protein D
VKGKFVNNLHRNSDIVWRIEKRKQQAVIDRLEAGDEIEDEGTVILLISGMMHQLNLLGGMIWNLCDGTRTIDSVVFELQKEFDVTKETLQADVQEFIDDLVERGWLSYDQSAD